MGSKSDDDSFIVLGSSPGSSLDICGTPGRNSPWQRSELEDAMVDLSDEASLALQAHFKPGEGPSLPSMMVASNIVTDDKSTHQLQREFGQIIDENIVLKETLKQNNESMKQQFSLLASCQEDIFQTHLVNKEKFQETRDLVMQLRRENKQLKKDIIRLAESVKSNGETGEDSDMEHGEREAFVQRKISEQIEAFEIKKAVELLFTFDQNKSVEQAVTLEHKEIEQCNAFEKSEASKQNETLQQAEACEEEKIPEEGEGSVKGYKSGRTSVASSALEFVTSPDDDVINKLTYQLELVEKQRREVIVTNEKLQWQKESLEHMLDSSAKEIEELKFKVADFEAAKEPTVNKYTQNVIHKLEQIIQSLNVELAAANVRVKDGETAKLEFAKQKSELSKRIQSYRDRIEELQVQLKEITATVFPPVNFNLNSTTPMPETAAFMTNIKVYEETLKEIAQLFNKLIHDPFDCLVHTQKIVECLEDYNLDVEGNREHIREGLSELKTQLGTQNGYTYKNIMETRNAIKKFEGIFADCSKIINQIGDGLDPNAAVTVERQLTAALAARGKEIQGLQAEIRNNATWKEEVALLKEQLDCYKSDFLAEREARSQMASDRDNLLADLRSTQKHNQELIMQLEEVKNLNPNVYELATKKRAATISRPKPSASQYNPVQPQPAENNLNSTMKYSCPKCQRFSSDQYNAMEDHFDFCLDDF